MKTHLIKKCVLLAVIAAVPFSLTVAGGRKVFMADSRGSAGGPASARGSMSFVSKAAASQTVAGSSAYAYDEVQSMVGRSGAVVVGLVLSNECRLLPDKKQVETAYAVEVQQVLKGGLASGSKIEVSTPGGLVLLKEDGSEVSKKNKLKGMKEEDRVVIAAQPGYGVSGAAKPFPGVGSTKYAGPAEPRPMVNGQTYLLFLEKKAGGGYGLTPTQQAYAGLRGATAIADLDPSVLDNVRLAVERENGQ